jgi:hypothetical protein
MSNKFPQNTAKIQKNVIQNGFKKPHFFLLKYLFKKTQHNNKIFCVFTKSSYDKINLSIEAVAS